MGTRISSLLAAGSLTGAERFVVSQPSTTATLTGTNISVDASDNSINCATADFVALGFVAGNGIGTDGFGTAANNLQQPGGVIESVSTTKIVLSAGSTLVTEAAGANATVTMWVSRQLDYTTMCAALRYTPASAANWNSGVDPGDVDDALDQLASRVKTAESGLVYTQSFVVAVTGESQAVTTGTSKVTFRMPFAFTLSGIRASLNTAQASGSVLTVDVNEGGTSILSTKLTFDNTEKTTTTAATAAVISDVNLADDAEITVDVDQVGDGTAAGLKVALIGKPGTIVESLVIPVTDELLPIAAGTAKATFRMPYAFTLTGIRASLSTAQTSGSIFTVDVNEGGVSLLSTKLTIDNTEKTSTTAATAPVLSDTALADDAEITVDVDQIGDGTARGLKITLIGYRTT